MCTMAYVTILLLSACVLHLLCVAGGVTMCSVSHSYRCPHAGIFPHNSHAKVYYRCESSLMPAMWCVCPPGTEFDSRRHICAYIPHSRTKDSGYHIDHIGHSATRDHYQKVGGIHTESQVAKAITASLEPSLGSSLKLPATDAKDPQRQGIKMHKRLNAARRTANKRKRDKSQKGQGKKVNCKDGASENDLLKVGGCDEVTTEATTPVNRALPTPQPYKQPQEERVLYDNSLIPAWAIALLVLIVIIMAMAVVMIMY